jgi:hypothetical protein
MTKNYLEDVKFYHNWNTLAGTLHGLLDYYGEKYTRSQIMGLSTLAFRINLDKEIAPYCPTTFDFTNWLNNISKIFGIDFTTTMIQHDTPDYETLKNTTIDKIIEYTDNHNPVMYFDPEAYEWYLITGYNKEAKELIIAGTDGEYAITYPEFGTTDEHNLVWCLFPTKTEKLDTPEVFYTALNHAVTHYFEETPSEKLLETGYAYGHKAWHQWIDVLKNNTINEFGHAYNLRVIRSAREDAWNFLNFLYDMVPNFKTDEIENAITGYRHTIDYLLRTEDLYPFYQWTEATITPDDHRTKQCVEWLTLAYEWETKAIENIKTFLKNTEHYTEITR